MSARRRRAGSRPAARRLLGVAAVLSLGPGVVRAQEPERLAVLLRMQEIVSLVGSEEPALWPGFRPDTVPLVVVFPDGAALLGWRAPLPDGFASVPGNPSVAWRVGAVPGAASTRVTLEGRAAAQLVADARPSVIELVALAAHETFHVFQAAARREGRRFGAGENSFLVTQYPVFDVANEAELALEGRLLQAALEAPDDDTSRGRAQAFLAVRRARQQRLGAELAEFEAAAELNEGLAEYAGLRALKGLVGRMAEGAAAEAKVQRDVARLGGLITDPTRSIRLRYYVTGSGTALLLDRLAGEGWRDRLVEGDLTLQAALGEAVGLTDLEATLRREAALEFGGDSLSVLATGTVRALSALRRAQADSVLAAPGLRLVLEAAAVGLGLCGIDPQNLLQVEPGVLLHRRWVRACSGEALQAELTTAVVHDRSRHVLQAGLGPEEGLRITAEGEPLQLSEGHAVAVTSLALESATALVRVARATVRRMGDVLTVTVEGPLDAAAPARPQGHAPSRDQASASGAASP